MQQKHPLITVSLPLYNGEKYIRNCLNSVFRQTYPNFEIIVIDNGSTDKSKEYLKEFKKDNLRIIFSQENLGYAGGHNLGIKESRGEYILCLTQDVMLDPHYLQRAIELFKKDKKVGALQGKLFRWQLGMPASQDSRGYHVSHIIDTVGLVIFKNRRIINQGQGEVDQGQFEKVNQVFGPDGACPVYRKKALEDVAIDGEYFDQDFFMYKEDVDLAWRLNLYGWKSFYQPRSIAWHDRTAGDSLAINYIAIIKERLKISKFGKYLAFKNQRLMQLKNEQISLLLIHLPWFLPKEIASWIYVLLFERFTWKAIKDLFKQSSSAWKKRKIIMRRKRISSKEMRKWFQ